MLVGNLPLAFLLCKCDKMDQSQSDQSSTCRFRCLCVLFCTAIFVLRVLLQMSVFCSRGIPWKEVIFEAGGVIPLSVGSMALGASGGSNYSNTHSKLMLEMAGILVFLFGTWLNLYPEWQRHRWKRAGNAGRLYTGGFFCVCSAHQLHGRDYFVCGILFHYRSTLDTLGARGHGTWHVFSQCERNRVLLGPKVQGRVASIHSRRALAYDPLVVLSY